MNLDLSDDQRLLADAIEKLFAGESTSERVRAAEPLGFDPALWGEVAAFGLPLLRVPESAGGSGCGLLEAVLAVESAGRYLASVPLAEAIVAAGLLAALDDAGAAALASVSEGRKIVLALADAAGNARQVVPGAAVADAVVYRAGGSLFLQPLSGTAPAPNFGSLPAASVVLGGGTPLSSDAAHLAAYDAAVAEWKLLTAAAMAAGARRALDNAAEYACERHAFGRPIGSYQGLAHPMADAVAAVEGARLLVLKAIEAIEKGEADAAGLPAAAYWWAAKSAADATIIAMRVFGGYGMTLEYDAQLFYRRVIGLSLLAGNPERQLDIASAAFFLDGDVPVPASSGSGLDFAYAVPGSPEAKAADDTRAVFAAEITPEVQQFLHETDDGQHWGVEQALAKQGLLYVDWPKELGGRALGPLGLAAVHEVFSEVDWCQTVSSVTDMVAKMIMWFGSEAAKTEILPILSRGEAHCCLGYSEPSGGSDVFAARTTARLDGDHWIINGQKMFTSQGHFAKYCLLIARTGEDKHGGVTLFAIPIDGEGYSVNKVETVGGERTNVTFYSDMKVHDRYRLGEVGGGVKVMVAALSIEQGGSDFFAQSQKVMLRAILDWAQQADDGVAPISDAAIRQRIGEAKIRMLVSDLLARRAAYFNAVGRPHKAFGPMAKLFGSEAWVKTSHDLLRMAAPASMFRGYDALGTIEKESRRSVPGTIYAGTSEVQRSLIAESILKLPRSRS